MATAPDVSRMPFEKRNAVTAPQVTRSVGLSAETENPRKAVPAALSRTSFFSFGDQKTKRTPSAIITTAVTACETGTTMAWRARKVVYPQKASPA
jgi:hypothetical protein